MKANAPTPAGGDRLDFYSESFERQYALGVEITNGRAAMIGFLVAVLVEAGTGKGIILQVCAVCVF